MAGNLMFDKTFRGYSRKQVDEHLRKLTEDNESLRLKYEDLSRQKNDSDFERSRIARTLIKAQEKAEAIVSDAEKEAALKRKKIEDEINTNKQILVGLKEEIVTFRNKLTRLFKSFDGEIEIKESAVKPQIIAPENNFEKIDDDFKVDEDFETI